MSCTASGLVFTFLLLTTLTQAQEQRDALEIFYDTCNGDNWVNNENWLGGDVCDWFGITCEDGSVRKIELPRNDLDCNVPAELFALSTSSLKVLDLQGNSNVNVIWNDLPTGETLRLEKLYLQDTGLFSLDGIFNALSTLTLTSLGAGGNFLEGDFPMELTAFTSLQHLDLSHNMYTGAIPQDIGSSWQFLRTWSMAHNMLSGGIPDSVGSMTDLSLLFLQDNALEGPMPAALGELPNLSTLFLNNQQLDGPLLDFASNPSLLILSLQNNRFEGDIPQNFLESVPASLSPFMIIDLRNNVLEGSVGPELGRFPTLRFFASGNRFNALSAELCTAAADWYFGEVLQFGCDGILCPPGTFNSQGRQAFVDFPCQTCESGTTNFFFGGLDCPEVQVVIGKQGQEEEKDPNDTSSVPTLGARKQNVPRHIDDNPDNDVASLSWIMFLQGEGTTTTRASATPNSNIVRDMSSATSTSSIWTALVGAVLGVLAALC